MLTNKALDAFIIPNPAALKIRQLNLAFFDVIEQIF